MRLVFLIAVPCVASALNVDSLGKYKGYAGTLRPQGRVTMTHSASGVEFSWTLEDLDPRCTKDFTVAKPNGCGIHIHSGTSCDDALGHFYVGSDDTAIPDPWKDVRYEVPTEAGSLFSARVSSGSDVTVAGVADPTGKTFVVHDAEGVRTACGVISSAALGDAELFASNFVLYKGSTWKPQVEGFMHLLAKAAKPEDWQFRWSLQGVAKDCAATTGKQCAVQVTTDESCDSATGTTLANSVHYSSSADGIARLADKLVNKKYTMEWSDAITTTSNFMALLGKTVVVHDSAGKGIACAVLTTAARRSLLFVNSVQKYTGYDGALKVEGHLLVDTANGGNAVGSQKVKWAMSGADSKCTKETATDRTGNQCGIHIHAGDSCSSDGLGHYWRELTGTVDADPWTALRYEVDAEKMSINREGIDVVSHVSALDVMGKVVVVHDSDEKRIACGVLDVSTDTFSALQAKFETKDEPVGALEITSKTVGTDRTSAQTISGKVDGLGTKCSAPGCRIAVAQSTKCSDDKANEAYSPALSTNPWLDAKHVQKTSSRGSFAVISDVVRTQAEQAFSIEVVTGMGGADFDGLTMSIYDNADKRIACAPISYKEDSSGDDGSGDDGNATTDDGEEAGGDDDYAQTISMIVPFVLLLTCFFPVGSILD